MCAQTEKATLFGLLFLLFIYYFLSPIVVAFQLLMQTWFRNL